MNYSTNGSPDDEYIRKNAKIQAFINSFQRNLELDNNDQMLNNAVNNLNKDISKYDMVQSLISKIENQSGFFTNKKNKKDKYNKLLTIINDDFKDYNTGRNLNEIEIKQILQLRGGKSRKTKKANKRKSKKSRKANKRKTRKTRKTT